MHQQQHSSRVLPPSPGSPENAIKVCWFRFRVLSSVALRTVGPLMAALEAAMMTKSFPVIPSRTSLSKTLIISFPECVATNDGAPYILIGNRFLTS